MPSNLQKAKSRAETLTKFAIQQHNRRAKDIKGSRLKAERKAEQMVREQKIAHKKWQREQERRANEGGAMAGMFQGAATGASVGSLFPGAGTAIGAGIGAVAGGLYGHHAGRQAVADVAPYAAGVSQVAGGISQMRASKERNEKMMKMYGQIHGQRGRGFGDTSGGLGGAGITDPELTPIPTAGGVSLAGGQGLAAPYVPTGARFGSDGPRPTDYGFLAPPMQQVGARTDAYRARGAAQGSPHLNYYLQQLEGAPFNRLGR